MPLPDCFYFSSYSVKHASCLDISVFVFRISEKLEFDYLNNEKNFRIEIKKTFFLALTVLSFRLIKQTSKNIADTTFNQLLISRVLNILQYLLDIQ